MFILDNSGSMALVSMPTVSEDFDVQDPNYTGTSTGASRTGLKDNPHDRSYLNNAIYYDPRINYQPWLTADGTTRLTGGTDPTSVFLDWNLADTGRGTRDLRGNSESIFYVPKTGTVAGDADPTHYDKYWINASGKVVTAAQTQVSGFPKGPLSWSMDYDTQRTFTINASVIAPDTSASGWPPVRASETAPEAP